MFRFHIRVFTIHRLQPDCEDQSADQGARALQLLPGE